MNFAASASKPQDGSGTPLKAVQIDGQVVMKIVKHCTEHSPSLVTGQLLGLDIGATLEVTDCFPFPSTPVSPAADEDVDPDAGADYQLEMMRCLREINVDNNTVGWYQSTYLGSYYTEELIETFLAYQENIKRCVCIVYDPSRSANQGTFSLKALRLTDRFYEIHKAGAFTFEKIADKSFSWSEIVTETPVTIRNSALAAAVFGDLALDATNDDDAYGATRGDLDRLNLSTNPFLERSLEFLSECMDDLASEQQKVAFHNRNISRQQVQHAQWLQKRKQENAQRKAAGQEPLPEEDEQHAKNSSEPSRLEGFLIANQVNQYVDQIQEFGQASLQKLYLVSGTQGVDSITPTTTEA